MTNLAFATAADLSDMIRRRKVGCRELTEFFIERIERQDGAVNAVVVRDFERARAAADAADAALAAGEDTGPLHGVPVTVKEAFDVAGLPTCWGVPELASNVAAADSEAVRRLKSAGAVVLGKTNVPLLLDDFQTYNDVHGVTGNPWDPARTPGGSSGGSAAALAAGLTALECGSDIGGSIRNPAHYCGVYGHKPTWGVVSMLGHALPALPAPSDIAVAGPLARSAEDLALAMDVLAGPDPLETRGWKLELPRSGKPLPEYRVALWPTEARAPVATEIADRVQSVGDYLAGVGARVSDTARPAFDLGESHRLYVQLLGGVVAAGIPDGEFAQAVARAEGVGPDDPGDGAVMTRALVQRHRDWLHADEQRKRLRLAWRAFFEDWDVLICPQMATTAFEHDHRPVAERRIVVDGTEQPYFQQVFWAGLIGTAYLPSTVFPTGPSLGGLPIGLQAVGAAYDDYLCLDFARLVGEAMGGFAPPPGY